MIRHLGALRTIFTAAAILILPINSYAVPSFARQTGMQCAACHTTYPQLTPFGREFKLKGYTLSNEQSRFPPLAVMLQPSFTHTDKGQAGGAADGFDDNNNFALTQASVFYAGRLFGAYTEALFGEHATTMNKLGIFLQSTYDGVEKSWSWDNVELRYADNATIRGSNVDYGFYLNNNPTLQDPWNTTPAWGFPYTGSGLAPTPTAATLIGGTVAQQVGGLGGYAKIADKFYVELGGYKTLGTRFQSDLGTDPDGETQIADLAPYWRFALDQPWGSHRLEVGTYGLAADTYPGRDASAGKDHILDIGIDSEYQYSSGPHDVTLMLNWLRERQNWDASLPLGIATNSKDILRSLTATGSYIFDKTYGATAQYFAIDGDTDPLLYPDSRTGSPSSNGWIVQLDYLPFNKQGGIGPIPDSNVKLSLQYTHYNQFDGSSTNYDGAGRNARDNDTLYLEGWLAF